MDNRALVSIAVGLTVLGCAARLSAQSPGQVTRPIVVETPSGTQVLNVTSSANVQQVTLRAPPSRAWARLPGVYRALGLPLTASDSAHYLLGTVEQRLRRIGGRGMSAFFDCPGAYENLAATGDVTVTVRTQLLAQGDSASQAYTEISAVARSRTGGQQVVCSSMGQLEPLLEQKLLAAADSTAH